MSTVKKGLALLVIGISINVLISIVEKILSIFVFPAKSPEAISSAYRTIAIVDITLGIAGYVVAILGMFLLFKSCFKK